VIGVFSAHKKRQGWERRERRKRDNPSPAKMLLRIYTEAPLMSILFLKKIVRIWKK
jgi:hypothetical protein